MKKDIFVIGTGGLAKEIAQMIHIINQLTNKWNFRGYVGESAEDVGTVLPYGSVVAHDKDFLASTSQVDVTFGVGYPKVRQQLAQRYLNEPGRFNFPNLIHPRAMIELTDVKIGLGNIITCGCIFTCEIVVGHFNLFNLNATIGHDTVIGDSNIINPSVNISGNVILGDANLLGTGAQILERRKVGDHCSIGAGAVVTKDVETGTTVVGIPAKPLPAT